AARGGLGALLGGAGLAAPGAALQALGVGQGGVGCLAGAAGGLRGDAGGALARGLDAAAGLVEQAFELLEEIVRVGAAPGDQAADELVGVGARHAPALDGVVDHLLEAIAGERHAALERLAKGLHALVSAGRRRPTRRTAVRLTVVRGHLLPSSSVGQPERSA